MGKPRQIKIWPEIISYIPALIHIPTDIKSEEISIDFRNCLQVDATGLNILLGRLLKLDLNRDYMNTHLSILTSNNKSMENKLISLGFMKLFKENLRTSNILSLYNDEPENINYVRSCSILQDNIPGVILHSYPIFMFNFDKYEERRDAFGDFKNWLANIFERFNKYDISKKEIILILKEIFKNSADHTNDKASFAIDITESKLHSNGKKGVVINFSFTDFGKGICKNIWESIPAKERNKRKRHVGIAEAYHKAMQMGFSTKSNISGTKNMGLGMSIIIKGAKSINMNLSVFDAKSRGILTAMESHSHAEIRKHFYATGSNVNFSYYGSIICEGI